VDRVLERFVAAHGVVPDSLGDFLPPRGTTAIDFWHDGWGTEFQYKHVGEAGWRLRAAGADLRFCTPDDEVREGAQNLPAAPSLRGGNALLIVSTGPGGPHETVRDLAVDLESFQAGAVLFARAELSRDQIAAAFGRPVQDMGRAVVEAGSFRRMRCTWRWTR